MPKGIPLTEDEQLKRRREIVSASVELFLDQGFPETSMRAIAAAAGMGKSSLYDYFKTKDDILLFIIEDITIALTERARVIAREPIAPDARIRQIIEMELGYLQANNRLFLLLNAEAQRLHIERQKRLQERRYAFQDLVKALIEEGIAQGCFRQLDALLAARLLINSLVSVVYTTRPTGSPEAMLDQAVDIVLRGMKP